MSWVFGALTMNTYEQGAAPDSANRLLLKLAENPVFFKAMYSVNSQRIGATQRKRIESSPGYKSADSWTGLEALAASLTAVQRAKVEACAESGQQSVLQQVVTYVSAGSFEEYSNLIRGATWSASSSGLLDQRGYIASRRDEGRVVSVVLDERFTRLIALLELRDIKPMDIHSSRVGNPPAQNAQVQLEWKHAIADGDPVAAGPGVRVFRPRYELTVSYGGAEFFRHTSVFILAFAVKDEASFDQLWSDEGRSKGFH